MSSRSASLRMTRRQWAAGLTEAIGAAPMLAQVPSKVPPQGPPAAPPPTAPAQERLQKAYADVYQVRLRLSQIEMPMDIEPAFAFRA
jgi:hypothetical protein